MKIAYIAHPVGGDVQGNITKIIAIVRKINKEELETVPFVSYIADLHALDDNIPEERARGIKNGLALLKAGFISEIRLYGNKISAGMKMEIEICKAFNIPIVPMTEETKKEFAFLY